MYALKPYGVATVCVYQGCKLRVKWVHMCNTVKCSLQAASAIFISKTCRGQTCGRRGNGGQRRICMAVASACYMGTCRAWSWIEKNMYDSH